MTDEKEKEKELTIKEFFERYEYNADYERKKDGIRGPFIPNQKELLNLLNIWIMGEQDDRCDDRNVIWNILYMLDHLRSSLVRVIRNDLNTEEYKEVAIRDLKHFDSYIAKENKDLYSGSL